MNTPRLLLVEDNPADADLILETLRESGLHVHVELARDGQQAFDMLHQRDAHATAEPPNLVILDLNLPKLSGRDVLAYMRADERLRRVPVIVLTSSANEHEIVELYATGANCYLTKPIDHGEFISLIRAAAHFWLSVAKLPR